MTTQKLTSDIINAAIEGFEYQKSRIDAQIAELRSMLKGEVPESAPGVSGKKKRMISAAGRRAIAEAQRKRWASAKGHKPETAASKPKAKRRLSKEGRAAIVAALKKRWAAKKAATATAKG